ncbi:tetraspanin family protein [Onchocerca flexuosa]|uniref:Tetraspanin n=1 Tax=Onchocerca flexuosa TaxID=387005 RepID=A0A238C666_9BILA|nr:tetraspanin family protein [Onchocerca flexuosa]
MIRRNDCTRRMPYNEKSCYDIRLLQKIIYFFNFLFYISSVAFIGLAIWTYTMKYTMIGSLLYSSRYLQSIILCFVIGLAVFVVASSGCWAISRRKQLLLLLYTVLVLLTMLMELALCIMTYAYIEHLKNNLGTTLFMSVIRDHSERNDISEALHYLHQQGHCCGSRSFEDWRDSIWWQKVNSIAELKQRPFDLAVPDFCCRSERLNCGRRDHPSNIYYNGCLDYLIKTMEEQLLIISGTAFAFAVVQLFGIGFAACLYTKRREFLEFRPVSSNSRQRDDATVMYSI